MPFRISIEKKLSSGIESGLIQHVLRMSITSSRTSSSQLEFSERAMEWFIMDLWSAAISELHKLEGHSNFTGVIFAGTWR